MRLVRTFDGNIGNQVASVTVDGQPAGSWKAEPEQWGLWVPETIDLPASLTQGKSQITVKNTFVSSAGDFNEYGYQALSSVGGQWVQTDQFDLGPGNAAQEQAHSYTITSGNLDGSNAREQLPSTSDQAAVTASDNILENAKIEISFDGQQTVNVPLGQFFGTGLGKWQIRSLFDGVDGGQGGWLSSWWPMPYQDQATITLVNDSQQTISQATAQVTAAPDDEWASELGPAGHAGYFHATYQAGPSTQGKDVNWLTANGTGKLVGVFMTQEGANPAQGRGFMEGDQHTWLDGSRTPQINGIATESIAMGGYYFNYGMFTGPLSGDPWTTAPMRALRRRTTPQPTCSSVARFRSASGSTPPTRALCPTAPPTRIPASRRRTCTSTAPTRGSGSSRLPTPTTDGWMTASRYRRALASGNRS